MVTKIVGQDGLAPILVALSTMQSNVQGKDKMQAHEYLEKFQKSVRKKTHERKIWGTD